LFEVNGKETKIIRFRYSEKNITKLKRAVDALNERSIIDLQHHDEG
jgi:hypothetical protein